MKKVIVLLKAMLILFFLTSCAPHGTTIPKPFIGSAEIFQVDDAGTVKVKGYNMKNQPIHWTFVHCDYWTGCYMRCQGPRKTCKSIAKKSDLRITHILTNH